MKTTIFFAVFCATFPSISMAKTIDMEKTLYIVTHHFPPYSACDGQTVTPSLIKDVVEQACRTASLSCLLECFPNRRSKSMLKSGAAHGNYPMGWNKTREQWLDWSPRINASEYGFYRRKGMGYSSEEDFIGKVVGVFGPSNTQKSLTRIRDKLLEKNTESFSISVQPDSSGSNMRKLSLGRIDGVFINKDGGAVQLKNLGVNNVEYAFATKQLNYYVAFSKEKNTGKRRELIDTFNRAIIEIDRNGILDNILRRYHISPRLEHVR